MFKRSKNRGDEAVPDEGKREQFEASVLPHLGAAYNLARWLTRNDHDAQDVVQESCLRAYKFFGGFRGGDGRFWFLTIVRNTCYTWIQQNRPRELVDSLDAAANVQSDAPGPEAEFIKNADRNLIMKALEELPLEFREILVLREMEGMSYKEISDISAVPLGTVMSRLARARKRLQQALTPKSAMETK
jgi:RNA polymerase sigma-70 factor (ECF subfamily)